MGKKSNKKKNQKEFDLIMTNIDDNDLILDLDVDTLEITYSKDFFVLMAKLLKEGNSAEEAYEKLGFPLSIYGSERAIKASYQTEKLSRDENFGKRLTDYGGDMEYEHFLAFNPNINEKVLFLKAQSDKLSSIVKDSQDLFQKL